MTLTPKLAPLAVGMTVAYLLLAIVGSGGFAAFFADPARIALAVVLFLMVGGSLFTNANLNPGEVEDRSDRWVLLAFTVLGLLAGYLPAYTERVGFWTFGGEAVRGSASFSAPPLARCDYGRSSSSAGGLRAGRDPAWARAGHDRRISLHPQSQLSRRARYLPRMGAGISFRCWRAADGAVAPAAGCAYHRGGGAAAQAFWGRVRRLFRPDVAACSGTLLTRAADVSLRHFSRLFRGK